MAGRLVVVTGVKELDRALRRLEPTLQKKVLRQALRKGAKILQIQTKSEAPVLTGATRASVKVRALKSRRRGSIGVEVRVAANERTVKISKKTGKRAFIPAIVEYGDKEHRPDPFMHRALVSRGEQVRRVIIEAIRTGIETIAGGK